MSLRLAMTVVIGLWGLAPALADELSDLTPPAPAKPALAHGRANSTVGIASWYGAGFFGRRTANGEMFDTRSLSAAHRTMPLPSYARVTNLTNGRSIVVRVNDRGPFVSGRMLDVSARVASLLGFHGGNSRVRLDYLGKAPPAGFDEPMLLASLKANDGAGPAAAPAAAPEALAFASAPAPQSPALLAAERASGAAETGGTTVVARAAEPAKALERPSPYGVLVVVPAWTQLVSAQASAAP